jgi:hypothetical protein
MSDFAHQSQPRAGVFVRLAVARMRWRRAPVDLRSRVDEGGATDFTFKAALFSAVFFSDLVLWLRCFRYEIGCNLATLKVRFLGSRRYRI